MGVALFAVHNCGSTPALPIAFFSFKAALTSREGGPERLVVAVPSELVGFLVAFLLTDDGLAVNADIAAVLRHVVVLDDLLRNVNEHPLLDALSAAVRALLGSGGEMARTRPLLKFLHGHVHLLGAVDVGAVHLVRESVRLLKSPPLLAA